jgi:hypothetical protein
MKHIEIKMLFVKELAQRGLIILKTIESEKNPVDALTKAVPQATLNRLAHGTECWQMNLVSETTTAETPVQTTDGTTTGTTAGTTAETTAEAEKSGTPT